MCPSFLLRFSDIESVHLQQKGNWNKNLSKIPKQKFCKIKMFGEEAGV